MFTYIRLKNFMSFHDVTFDFRDGKKVKSFAAIYGENGSGKSNFINSVDFIRRTLFSFEMRGSLRALYEGVKEENLPPSLVEYITKSEDILTYAEECRMIDGDSDTSVEIGFRTGTHDGVYTLSFNKRFNYEKLYYFSGMQTGALFEISQGEDKINTRFYGKFFKTGAARAETGNLINQYWGKHTFLGILCNERMQKNEEYIRNSYISYVFDFPDMLQKVNIHKDAADNPRLRLNIGSGSNAVILRNMQHGRINKKNEDVLDRSEKILRDFFTQAYADVKDVFYKKEERENSIQYNLFFKKMIAGKVRTIDFSLESSGTKRILSIIQSLFGVFCGMTVFYDEIDDGIHDLLLKNILSSMLDDITGQLIITTHNTYILQSISARNAYVIRIDYNGDKKVACFSDYGKIQPTNNMQNMYLKGLFGGVPASEELDYTEIINALHENMSEFAENGDTANET